MIGSIFQENYGLGSRREMEKDSEATPIRAFPTWAEPDQVFSCRNQFFFDNNLIRWRQPWRTQLLIYIIGYNRTEPVADEGCGQGLPKEVSNFPNENGTMVI